MIIKPALYIAIATLLLPANPCSARDPQARDFNDFRETVWLSTARHLYLAGETIDFTALVLEQDTYLKSELSKALRLELLDPEGFPLSQKNLDLQDSRVTGTLTIPADTRTGWHYIRAYTNWMRNMPSSEYSVIAIKIVNPVAQDTDPKDLSAVKINIDVYPDGKHSGIFTGWDKNSGLPVDGQLINRRGDTVASFSTGESGYAYIVSEIDKGQEYRAALDGVVPAMYNSQANIISRWKEGIEINDRGDYIEAKVSSSRETGLLNTRLLVHRSYTIIWDSGSLSSGQAVRVPKDILPPGIFQFSLIGNDDEILSARLWSNHRAGNIDFDVFPDHNPLKIRSEYTIDPGTAASGAELMVFAGRDEPFDPLNWSLPGLPGWPCGDIIPSEEKAFRGWLLAHHYPEATIRNLLEVSGDHNKKQARYLPETRSGVISGKVIDRSSGLGAANKGVSLIILNNNCFNAVNTDPNGFFYFALPGLAGQADYIINLISETDPKFEIRVDEAFDQPLKDTRKHFTLNPEELEYLREISTNLQIKKIYGIKQEHSPAASDSAITRNTFFHPPDYTVILEDFIKLANIREVIYEVVPNVSVRKSQGKVYLHVFNESSFAGDYETLVLLDGIPLPNQEEMLELPPDRIEKIEVKNKMYIHGTKIYSAIINFVSPNRDYAGLDLPSGSVLATISLPVSTALPQEKTSENKINIPLLESTLLWQWGSFNRKGTMDFETNDVTGDFSILVYGFDKQGKWLFSEKEFIVE